ncbi:unnamed protein product [Alopecurus aequalis]
MEQEAPGKPTERADEVTLRPFRLADVDAMMAWAMDPEVTVFMTWDPYPSREALLSFLRDTALPHPWFRAVCLPGAEDSPVGSVSVSPTADACRAELAYVLAVADTLKASRLRHCVLVRAHWGKGVATAAVKRAVATVFGEVEGLERVEALVDVRNVASQRVLEKAGFRREAVLRSYCVVRGAVRDMVVYSFIATDHPLVH